jgi:hypothetical protein
MDTTQLDTQGAHAITDMHLSRPSMKSKCVNRVKTHGARFKRWTKNVHRSGSIRLQQLKDGYAQTEDRRRMYANWIRFEACESGRRMSRGARKCVTKLEYLNFYEWWFNLSTKRRATRAAKHEYKDIIKNHEHEVWNDSLPDYGSDGREGVPTFPPVPPDVETSSDLDRTSLYSTAAAWNVSDGSLGESSEGSINQIVTASRPALKYKRGGRARDLAYAIEVQFGKMPYDKANYEVARRFASRHDLVESSSVRYAHRAALIKLALKFYFVTHEEDLVDHFVIDNKVNKKRTGQLAFTKW